MRMRNVILTLVLALSLGLTACEFGQVEQGRCVAFNPETKTLLVVLDVNHDQRNPHYSGGVHEYTLPADPSDCFRMNMNELATLSRHNIPVIEVVVNNHVLGMVRQWQTLFYGKRYSNTVLQDQADFVKVAEALGVKGIRVTKKEEMGPAIRAAIESGKPALIDVWIDCDEKVFPMVPAGAPIEDVFDAEDLAKKEQEKD